MTRPRPLAALAACGLLGGCQPPPIEVDLTFADGRPAGRFLRTGWFGSLSEGDACVDSLTVTRRMAPRRVDEAGTPPVLWAVERPAGKGCVDLPGFRYGVAPPGFVTAAPPRPLADGVVYELSVGGVGGQEYYFIIRPPGSGALADLRRPDQP